MVVRLNAAAVDVGITSGNSAMNSPATASAMQTNVPMKPQPSRAFRTANRPASERDRREHEEHRGADVAGHHLGPEQEHDRDDGGGRARA